MIFNFIKKDKRIKYVFEKNQGRAWARNKGVETASSDIILMTDQDCIVPIDWIKRMIKPIKEEEENIVMGFQRSYFDNYFSNIRQEEDWNNIKDTINTNYVGYLDTKNVAFKKEVFSKVMFDNSLKNFEDWDLCIQLKYQGYKIRFLKDVQVIHRHNSSISELYRTQNKRAYYVYIIIKKYKNKEEYRDILKNDPNYESFKLRNFILFIPWTIWQYITKPRKATFLVLSDLFWKIGLLKAKFGFKY